MTEDVVDQYAMFVRYAPTELVYFLDVLMTDFANLRRNEDRSAFNTVLVEFLSVLNLFYREGRISRRVLNMGKQIVDTIIIELN